MKKKILLTFLLAFAFIIPNVVDAAITESTLGYTILETAPSASELVNVKDYNVIDGDTADFVLDRENEPSIKARILLIDTPELKDNAPYAEEAKKRVMDLFGQADLIQIEYEGAKKDKYDRDLVHVWVDGILLQEILATEGYGIARYIHDYLPDSKYAETVYYSQDYAKRNKLNVWKDGNETYLSKAEYAPVATPAPATVVEQPAAQETQEAAVQAPVEQAPAQNVYYQNCTAVRAAGAAPIYPGDPGFQQKFDRDNDGIGCE